MQEKKEVNESVTDYGWDGKGNGGVIGSSKFIFVFFSLYLFLQTPSSSFLFFSLFFQQERRPKASGGRKNRVPSLASPSTDFLSFFLSTVGTMKSQVSAEQGKSLGAATRSVSE
mmetsp:Transcript_12823/g.25057  ORF Transcript_12823/g.25057 Transcript_12823/m.25057 type:complete len:114 (+) Transcript_12823:99-440(+)